MPIALSSAEPVPEGALSWMPGLAHGAQPITLTDYLYRMRGHGARMRYARNEVIFNQHDVAENFYQVLDGVVRQCRYMPDGRRYIVDFSLPGDIIGLTESPDQPVTCEAVTETLLVVYPRACFDRLARVSPELRTRQLCHLSASLMTAQQHLFVLGCQKAKERLASFLLRLADRMDMMEGDRLDLPMGRQDIADHLGLTIETVSRSFSSLRSDGAVLLPNSNQLILRDVHLLRSIAAEV